jgi:Fur family transcriptional regulator, ferric uptake regulator
MRQNPKNLSVESTQELERVLRARGYRLTKVRRFILSLFGQARPAGACQILSAADIQEALAARKISANKTTVYRELDFLQTENIICAVPLRDGTRRYEIASHQEAASDSGQAGHHHLVCVNCHKVEEAALGKSATALAAARAKDILAKDIFKNKRFKVLNQSQEFFGLCRDCQ